MDNEVDSNNEKFHSTFDLIRGLSELEISSGEEESRIAHEVFDKSLELLEEIEKAKENLKIPPVLNFLLSAVKDSRLLHQDSFADVVMSQLELDTVIIRIQDRVGELAAQYGNDKSLDPNAQDLIIDCQMTYEQLSELLAKSNRLLCFVSDTVSLLQYFFDSQSLTKHEIDFKWPDKFNQYKDLVNNAELDGLLPVEELDGVKTYLMEHIPRYINDQKLLLQKKLHRNRDRKEALGLSLVIQHSTFTTDFVSLITQIDTCLKTSIVDSDKIEKFRAQLDEMIDALIAHHQIQVRSPGFHQTLDELEQTIMQLDYIWDFIDTYQYVLDIKSRLESHEKVLADKDFDEELINEIGRDLKEHDVTFSSLKFRDCILFQQVSLKLGRLKSMCHKVCSEGKFRALLDRVSIAGDRYKEKIQKFLDNDTSSNSQKISELVNIKKQVEQLLSELDVDVTQSQADTSDRNLDKIKENLLILTSEVTMIIEISKSFTHYTERLNDLSQEIAAIKSFDQESALKKILSLNDRVSDLDSALTNNLCDRVRSSEKLCVLNETRFRNIMLERLKQIEKIFDENKAKLQSIQTQIGNRVSSTESLERLTDVQKHLLTVQLPTEDQIFQENLTKKLKTLNQDLEFSLESVGLIWKQEQAHVSERHTSLRDEILDIYADIRVQMDNLLLKNKIAAQLFEMMDEITSLENECSDADSRVLFNLQIVLQNLENIDIDSLKSMSAQALRNDLKSRIVSLLQNMRRKEEERVVITKTESANLSLERIQRFSDKVITSLRTYIDRWRSMTIEEVSDISKNVQYMTLDTSSIRITLKFNQKMLLGLVNSNPVLKPAVNTAEDRIVDSLSLLDEHTENYKLLQFCHELTKRSIEIRSLLEAIEALLAVDNSPEIGLSDGVLRECRERYALIVPSIKRLEEELIFLNQQSSFPSLISFCKSELERTLSEHGIVSQLIERSTQQSYSKSELENIESEVSNFWDKMQRIDYQGQAQDQEQVEKLRDILQAMQYRRQSIDKISIFMERLNQIDIRLRSNLESREKEQRTLSFRRTLSEAKKIIEVLNKYQERINKNNLHSAKTLAQYQKTSTDFRLRMNTSRSVIERLVNTLTSLQEQIQHRPDLIETFSNLISEWKRLEMEYSSLSKYSRLPRYVGKERVEQVSKKTHPLRINPPSKSKIPVRKY